MLTVPEPILLAIGRSAVLQAHVDRCLAVLYMEGLDEPTGNASTYRVFFSQLADMVGVSLKKRFPVGGALYDAFKAAVDESRKLAEERNDLVHSMWSFGPNFYRDKGTNLKVEKKGGVAKLEIKTRRLADLKNLVARMEAHVDMLTYLHPKAR